eukprot:1861208-Rhodomonas_salina.4
MQVPTYTIRGEGSIVGSSQFLNHAFSPAYRARTERVTVLMLEKAMPEAEPDTPVASVVTIQGLSTEELATFYKALAMLVGMQLSRVRAEAIRISGLRGFNDRQSIFQGQDERERLMNHCIKVFGLPVNEVTHSEVYASCLACSLMLTRQRLVRSETGAELQVPVPVQVRRQAETLASHRPQHLHHPRP